MEQYSWFKSEWHVQFDKSMQVSSLGERSRQAYIRAMRLLVEHCDKTPDRITEEELLDYFIHRQEVSGWSPATMRICHAGIKFFFKHVLKREWHLLHLARAKREKRLPAVLSREEVKKVLAKVTTFHNYIYLMTVYTCGLRLQEGLFLEVADIDDGPRKMIHIHRGKGAKTPLSPCRSSPMHCFAAIGRRFSVSRGVSLCQKSRPRSLPWGPSSVRVNLV